MFPPHGCTEQIATFEKVWQFIFEAVSEIISVNEPLGGKDWRDEFDKKFTVIVEYHKWSDEDSIQKLSEPAYIWNDMTRENPKYVKKYIKSLLDSVREEYKGMIEKVYEDWEIGIRFAWKDEEGTVLDCKVMEKHLQMSKDEVLKKL